MPFEFDHATRPTPLGNGVYDTPVEDRWDINGNANGGTYGAGPEITGTVSSASTVPVAWWTLYGDATLNALQDQADDENQDDALLQIDEFQAARFAGTF